MTTTYVNSNQGATDNPVVPPATPITGPMNPEEALWIKFSEILYEGSGVDMRQTWAALPASTKRWYKELAQAVIDTYSAQLETKLK